MTVIIPADALSAIQSAQTADFCDFAAFALVIYHSILTSGEEVRLIWGKRPVAAALFLSNRVAIMGWSIMTILWIQPIWRSQKSCQVNIALNVTFEMMLWTVWAVLSALRVYAISRQTRWLAAITLFLGLVPVVFVIVFQFIKTYYVIVPHVYACDQNTWLSEADIRGEMLTSRSCTIASDVIVLLATWYYLHDLYGFRHNGKGSRLPVANVLLRDGTFYFALILVLNVTSTIFFWLENYNTLQTFINPIISIVVTRFILDVRQAADTDDINTESQAPSFVRSRSLSTLFLAFASDPSHRRRTNSDDLDILSETVSISDAVASVGEP